MGDIGFQNLSKVVLQNRPNVLALMLDTQVYSNTGGQNSDSSPLTGGFDMNQMGAATQGMLHLEAMLPRITQSDVVNRRYLQPEHRSYIPDFGVYIEVEEENGAMGYRKLSRQMTLFCVERRKAWRLLQSKAGLVNRDYLAQKALLAKVELALEDFLARSRELMDEELAVQKKRK